MLFRILIIFLLISFSLKADQYDNRLEGLFNVLLATDNEIEINQIISNIWNIWNETNDQQIEADFYRGIESMRTGDLNMSISFFTRVIEKNPTFAEGWNKRATVYYMIGEFDKSMQDISETLKLEPRHFGAMDGMSLIFIKMQQFEKAIEIYDQMLKIFPYSSVTKEKKDRMLEYISKSA